MTYLAGYYTERAARAEAIGDKLLARAYRQPDAAAMFLASAQSAYDRAAHYRRLADELS